MKEVLEQLQREIESKIFYQSVATTEDLWLWNEMISKVLEQDTNSN